MKKKKTRTDRCVLEMTWLFVVVSLQCSRYIFDFTVSRSRRFVIRLSFACLCIYLYKHLSVLCAPYRRIVHRRSVGARGEPNSIFLFISLSLSFSLRLFFARVSFVHSIAFGHCAQPSGRRVCVCLYARHIHSSISVVCAAAALLLCM